MTEQLVMPPAHVWNKIEIFLDEQDKRRKFANEIISNSFASVKKAHKRKNLYVAAVAGVSVLAGLFWMAK